MKPATVKVRLQLLRTALNWAVEQGLLAKCPKFPSVKVPDRKLRPVPAESLDYYANVDDAVMEAVLGKKEERPGPLERNASRNNPDTPGLKSESGRVTTTEPGKA